MANTNLFTKKRATAKTTKAKKETKPVVVVHGDEFSKSLEKFNRLRKEAANIKSELAAVEGEIKDTGVDKFVGLYENGKRNPGSFKLESDSGEKVLVVPTDRYLKIDDERAQELKDEYGDEIVEEKTTWSFNAKLLGKYQDEISELIMGADFMSNDEKEDLIVPNVALNIKKGAINEAMTLGKGNVIDFLADIAPVVSLKQTT